MPVPVQSYIWIYTRGRSHVYERFRHNNCLVLPFTKLIMRNRLKLITPLSSMPAKRSPTVVLPAKVSGTPPPDREDTSPDQPNEQPNDPSGITRERAKPQALVVLHQRRHYHNRKPLLTDQSLPPENLRDARFAMEGSAGNIGPSILYQSFWRNGGCVQPQIRRVKRLQSALT